MSLDSWNRQCLVSRAKMIAHYLERNMREGWESERAENAGKKTISPNPGGAIAESMSIEEMHAKMGNQSFER
jgi:hypothetical protein